MKCSICKREFKERDIQESHDVPCYLFFGIRKVSKQQADKFPRRMLCLECHLKYELWLNQELINFAFLKSKEYFPNG